MNGPKPPHDSAGHATYQSTKKSVKFIFVAFAQEKHATIPPNAKAVVKKKMPRGEGKVRVEQGLDVKQLRCRTWIMNGWCQAY